LGEGCRDHEGVEWRRDAHGARLAAAARGDREGGTRAAQVHCVHEGVEPRRDVRGARLSTGTAADGDGDHAVEAYAAIAEDDRAGEGVAAVVDRQQVTYGHFAGE